MIPRVWPAGRRLVLVQAVAASVALMMQAPAAEPAGQHRPAESPVPEGLAASDWQSIREAYEAGRHAFHAVDGGWQAANPGQQWITRFDGRGFTAKPGEGTWSWGLELLGYGFGAHQTQVGGTARVSADGQRLSYRWDALVEEWFVNDARGLEHGFTVARRPDGAEPGSRLSFTMGTRGGLTPEVTAQAVGFCDASGTRRLNYAGLKVWDADGRVLGSWFEAAGGAEFRLVVDDRDARYPLTIDPIAQQAYLRASNTSPSDNFGQSVSVSGDTVVVGADREDSVATGVDGYAWDDSASSSGAAYVFVRNGTSWSQQAYLKASNTGTNDRFGYSVSVSGDTVVVGAYQEDSAATGVNGNQADNSLSSAGAAYVFVRSGITWSQQAYLKASHTNQSYLFGYSVSVSGDTVVVGASQESSNATGVNGNPLDGSAAQAGAAYVFVRDGTSWSQQAYLKASNTGEYDNFGTSVSVSGDTVVVGADREDSVATGVNGYAWDDSASSSGAAYVFVRSGTSWSQQAYLKASNTGEYDEFGYSVSVSGDTVVVGANGEDSNATGVNGNPSDNSALSSGAAYVFVRNGSTWSQQAYLKASNTDSDDKFGASVAVSGDTVVVGASGEDSNASGVNGNQSDNSVNFAGAAYVFARSGTTWSQQAYLKAGNTGEFDDFGHSVAVSADTVVVSARGEDSSAGAGYIFRLPPFTISPWVNDATSGIGSATVWARRFGVGSSATINGVTLAGTGYTVSSPEFDLSGPGFNYDPDDVNNLTGLTGEGSAEVAKHFSFGGNPATLTFKNLTPGFTYAVTLLSVGWDATPGLRVQTLSSGGETYIVDQNVYGDNAGLRIDHAFTADSATRTLTITPQDPGYSFHLYAVALRLIEFSAPTDFKVVRHGGNYQFSFTSAMGLDYTLKQSDNLQGWTGAGAATVVGDGTLKSISVPAPQPGVVPKRFYRMDAE